MSIRPNKEPDLQETPLLPEVFRGRSEALAPRDQPLPAAWNDRDVFSFDRYLHVLWRRKWLLLAIVLTTVVYKYQAISKQAVFYTASATLQLDPRPTGVVPYQGFEPAGGSSSEYLQTQIVRMQSRAFAERVEARLGRALSGSIGVNQVPGTLLLQLTVTSGEAEHAVAAANAAADEWVEQDLERRMQATAQASKFLEDQLQSLQGSVQKSEEDLLDYARGKSIVNLNDRQSSARQRLDELNAQLSRVQGEMFTLKTQADILERSGDAVLADELRTDQLRMVDARLLSVEGELATMSQRFGPEWPAIKRLQDERQSLLDQRAAERTAILVDARKDYEVKRGLHDKLVAELGQQRGVADNLNKDLVQFDILQRDTTLNKGLYEGVLQRLREGGIAASLESSGLQVVERAQGAGAVAPNVRSAVLQALMLGLALGLAAVVIAELLDNSIKTIDDVSRGLGLPTLGVVPTLASGGPSRVRLWARRRGQDATSPALAFATGRGRGTSEEEAYRSLRTSLLLSHSGTPPQVILVTSSFPREGKSTTAVNVAVSLAQTGARTLIIDLDLRKSSVAGVFGLDDSAGMSAYLSGNSDLSSEIRESGFPNLFVVPAGPTPPNPAELIGSTQMDACLRLVREYFAYVVIDSPPCVGLSDAVLLAPRVDGVILIARAGKTPKRALMRAAEVLHRVGATFLGVLLNGVRREGHAYGYYGDYTRQYGRYFSSERANGRKTA